MGERRPVSGPRRQAEQGGRKFVSRRPDAQAERDAAKAGHAWIRLRQRTVYRADADPERVMQRLGRRRTCRSIERLQGHGTGRRIRGVLGRRRGLAAHLVLRACIPRLWPA